MISSGRTKFLSGFGNGRISDSCCRHKAFCIFKKQKTGSQLAKMEEQAGGSGLVGTLAPACRVHLSWAFQMIKEGQASTGQTKPEERTRFMPLRAPWRHSSSADVHTRT